jgi:hypothetical protein
VPFSFSSITSTGPGLCPLARRLPGESPRSIISTTAEKASGPGSGIVLEVDGRVTWRDGRGNGISGAFALSFPLEALIPGGGCVSANGDIGE